MMDLEYWATTDVGRVRDHNEDNFLVDKRLHLFVVCDGMGGHAAGEVASAMAVQIVREVLRSHTEVFERLESDPESLANRKSVLTLVEHAITEACSRIYHAAQEDLSKKGMGTTCSLLLLAQGRGFIGHVGDSRIYLYRQNAIHQITEDHSLINEMIRLGKIKKGEEHNLPHKNAVTRAVGVNEFVEVDTWELDVFKGDNFLLCSDGLSGYFKDDSQIAKLVDQEELQKVTQDCIDFANAGGGKDNITAVAIRVKGAEKKSENLQEKLEVMRANPFFRYLNYKDLVQVVNLSETVNLDADEWLFEADTDPGAMFLVISGTVGVGGADTSNPLGPGEVVGEMSMMDETPQAHGVQAIDEATLMKIKRDRFMGLLRSDEGLAVKLLWNFLQIWTHRLRKHPVDPEVKRKTGIGEPTPPSTNLAFEQDKQSGGHRPASVSGEFQQADLRKTIEADDSRAPDKIQPEVSATEPMRPAVVEADIKAAKASKPRRLADKLAAAAAAPSPSLAEEASAPNEREAMMKTIPSNSGFRFDLDPDMTVPDSALGDMQWDEIVPPDLLEEQDLLRETAQLEEDDLRETIQMEATDRNSIGKAISGESTTRSLVPGAQVLKRTKLIVGENGSEFDAKEHTKTRDVRPLPPRPKSDSTLELEIDDDSVEEVN